jgi:hypothetical protein
LVQIKSHAQKVLKRQEEGENIFRRLDENKARLDQLVFRVHQRLGGEPPASPPKLYRKREEVVVAKEEEEDDDVGDDDEFANVPMFLHDVKSPSVLQPDDTYHEESIMNDDNNEEEAVIDTEQIDWEDQVEVAEPPTKKLKKKKSPVHADFIAASALCKLAGPEDESDEEEIATDGEQVTTTAQAVDEVEPDNSAVKEEFAAEVPI